jgi:hypothetical protein
MIEVDQLTGNKFLTWVKPHGKDFTKKWNPVLESDIGKPIPSEVAKISIGLMLEQQKVVRSDFERRMQKLYPDEVPSWVRRATVVLQYSMPLLRRDLKLNVNWATSLSNDSSIKWVKTIDPNGVNFIYSILKADFLNDRGEIAEYFNHDKSVIQIAPLFDIDDVGNLIKFN